LTVSASLAGTSTTLTQKLPGFYGRETELAWLKGLWEEAATRDSKGAFGGPRLAMVIAETGLGKSRLVQELYQLLANDAVWNPPERSYWPRTIVSTTGKIHENPPLDDHVPLGPPRFLWLAARWQPIYDPNAEERTCVIPALRDSLYVHVRIAQGRRTIWERLRTSGEKKLKSEGPDYALGKLIDLTGIPFLGLFPNLIKAGLSLRNAPTSVSEAFQKQQEDAADVLLGEMHEVFGGLGGGGLVLPTVLWLDDAHWIDPFTLQFVHRLWKKATEKRWPLLVVLTHFEREWNELRMTAKQESLWGLCDQAHASPLFLAPAPLEKLQSRLSESLPGLLPAQRTLILQKVGGNFLTLVQNIGALTKQSACFEARRLDRPLTPAGERLVADWELDRDKRIEQQFGELGPELQDLLGWATNANGRAGMWFMPHAVAMFKARRGVASWETPASEIMEKSSQQRQLLDTCVYPLAVLGSPSPNIFEFRDRAFYQVARKYFKYHLSDAEQELTSFYHVLLGLMINETFDEHGDLRTGEEKMHIGKMEYRRFNFSNGWQNGEMRAQLDLAFQEYPLSEQPDWSKSSDRAALRTILLYLKSTMQQNLSAAIRQHGPKLRAVKWDDVPSDVASADLLLDIGDALLRSGLADVAGPMLEPVLSRAEKAEKPDSKKIIEILAVLSQIHLATYSFAAAEPLIHRMLQLQEQTLGADAPDVARSLNFLARLCTDLSRYEDAEKYLLRAWAIHERAFGKDAPETLTSIQEELGFLYIDLKRYTDAEKHFRHLLAVEQKTDPESPRAARISSNLGTVLSHQSNYKESESIQRRALAITERNFGPDQPEVVVCLNRLASVLEDQGRYRDAEPLLKRALEVSEKAYGPAHLEVAEALCMLAFLYANHEDDLAQPDSQAFAKPEGAAEPLLLRAIDIMERSSGHPVFLSTSLIILGNIYLMSKRDDEAYGVTIRALDRQEQELGPSDPEILEQLKDLMGICLRLGQPEMAEVFFDRAQDIIEHNAGMDGLVVAEWLEDSAGIYQALGKDIQAQANLGRAQVIRENSGKPTE